MRTNAGRDLQARQLGDTLSNATGIYAPANYIALSSNAAAPAASNTTLADEVAGGTLARKQAAYAFTNGATSYTLTATYVADQSITVRKIGVFNAETGGTMAFEVALTAEAVMVSGDQLQVTEIVTL